ncbi:hypothetical protein E4U55_003494 [Claviceps digitariae]|nr:hypothetical protein E4U55_003494 [Claviceps digitariae]
MAPEPEMSMLVKTLREQCKIEHGSEGLAIAKKLADAEPVHKQHVQDKESKKSEPQGNKNATCEGSDAHKKE